MEYSFNSLQGKRAILYTRVSTDEQAKKGFSLPAQKEQLEKWCQNSGVQVVAHFQEDGASAKSFERPEFKKILDLLQKNKNFADYLLVPKWDRFSRNATDAYIMIRDFGRMGITVNATQQWIDFSIPEQQFMLAIYVANSQVENEIRSNRTKTGMRRALKEGNWVHQAPKGYSFVSDIERPGKTCLLPNEEAPFIQEAFTQVSEGIYSVSSVLNMLNKKGFRCSLSHFHRLLRNMVYIGKTPIPAWKESKEEIVQGRHPAIVSEELFYRVQDTLKGLRKTRIRVNPYAEYYPLKGFLVCPQCKRPMTGNPAQGNGGLYYYYQCQQRGCSKSILSEKVHSAFLEYLRGIKVSPAIAELYHRIMKDIFQKREKHKTGQLKQIEGEINRLEERLLSIDDLFVDRKLDENAYQRTKRKCEEELRQLQIRKSECSVSESNYSKYLAFGMSMLSNIDVYYEKASLNVKRKMIGLITPGKMVFSENGVQTIGDTKAVALLSRFCRDVEMAKRKQTAENRCLSRLVTPRGFEPLLQE